MSIRRALSYDDVCIIPADYANIDSRSQPITLTTLNGSLQQLHPIIASPMSTVCDKQMIIALDALCCLGVLHRGAPYNNKELRLKIVKELLSISPTPFFGVAIGVHSQDMTSALELYDAGVRLIVVDVANGHNKKVIEFTRDLKRQIPDAHIMSGNVATANGFIALAEAGADSVRVGIGGGHACTTRVNTGVGVPTLQSVIDCAAAREDFNLDTQIVADGGCDNPGDVNKAIAAGADFVMAGSMFAGCDEAPSNLVWYNPYTKIVASYDEEYPSQRSNYIKVKEYKGMASYAVQLEQGKDGKDIVPEGVSTYVKYTGPVNETVKLLTGCLRNAMSYLNAMTIQEFQSTAELIEMTSGGLTESLPRSVYNLHRE